MGQSSFFRSKRIAGNTRPVFGFPGGIHPPGHKTDSSTAPIRIATLPSRLVIPLTQHLGAPAEPVVVVGDRVLAGQQIAKAGSGLSVPVHASSSGTVVAIERRPVQHPSGMPQPCIVIDTDGRDEWVARVPLADWASQPADALRARIREAGIAGMGGAGFPTATKLGPRQPVTTFILNAVECEPYITADDRLMRERAPQVIEGLKILRHVLGVPEVLVGIEDNKPEAIGAMRKAAAGTGIDIVVVPTKYPSGGEKQLIRNLTGKEVPSGGLPADVGIVCQNTGTAYAVYRAIVEGEPLVSRIVTLTGDALAQRGNVEARIGTPVIELLHGAGLKPGHLHRLVMGGPMMGFTLHDMQVPVVKTTNCLLAASAAELPDPAPEQACIRCGACAEACPASLLPQQLYWFSKAGEFDKAKEQHLMDCIECGACSWVCPSSIPLVQYYRYAKGEIRNKLADERKAERAKLRFEARQARIEREHAEREAKRKARAEAARARAAAGAEAAPADGTANAAAPAVDPARAAAQEALLKTLKGASLQASSDYKAAVKELKDAQAAGSTDTEALQRRVDELKARADAAKAAVRTASPAGGEAAATGTAEAAPAADDGSPATTAATPAIATDAPAVNLTTADATPVTAEQMKQLKAAAATAQKQHKEALAALEVAARNGADNLDALQSRIDGLRQKADAAKAELDDAVARLKAPRAG